MKQIVFCICILALLIGCGEQELAPAEVELATVVPTTTEMPSTSIVIPTAVQEPKATATPQPALTPNLNTEDDANADVLQRSTRTPTPTPTPTVTPTPTATPTPEPIGEIVEIADLPPLQPPVPNSGNNAEETAQLLNWLLGAWQVNMPFHDVAQALTTSRWSDFDLVSQGDIDRDGVDEWLINYRRPQDECFLSWTDAPCGGNFWVIGENGLEYDFLEDIGDKAFFNRGPEVIRYGVCCTRH